MDQSPMDFFGEVEEELAKMGSDIDPEIEEVAIMQKNGMEPAEVAKWLVRNINNP